MTRWSKTPDRLAAQVADGTLPDSALLVWHTLWMLRDRHQPFVQATVSTVAARCRRDRRTVQRVLRRLEETGWLSPLPRSPADIRRGLPVRYLLEEPVDNPVDNQGGGAALVPRGGGAGAAPLRGGAGAAPRVERERYLEAAATVAGLVDMLGREKAL